MSLVHVIQQHINALPPYQQAEVLDFVLFLEQKQQGMTVLNNQTSLRKPHPIAAQIKVEGDIFVSIPADDWDLPT